MSYEQFKKKLFEDGAPTNNVGGGNIAGCGVGPQGEPGIPTKKKKLVPRIKTIVFKRE